MSFNLIESVKEVLSGDMTNKIGGILGESSTNVQQAIQGIIPAILTGVLLKAEAGELQDTLNMATDASRIEIPFNLNSLAGGGGSTKGMDYLKILFGEKTTPLSESVAAYAGISVQSASSLMSIAAPATLGVLGKHILVTNMNASGLRSFLNSQRRKILNIMPTGLFLEGIMGFNSLAAFAERYPGEGVPEPRSDKKYKWLFPVILIILATAIIWYFRNKEQVNTDNARSLADTLPSRKEANADKPVELKAPAVKLPDGTPLNARKGGAEDQIILFLNDPDSKPSRRFIINFDQLNFGSGTAVITGESMIQIQNVASILKAYPKTRIKIGAFTERSGDSLSGKILSENRAKAVAAALRAAGVNENEITGVEGFGSDYAKYPADAADSLKARDRRVSISIRAK